jgi:uncharacterized membrane protein YfcA
MTGERLGWSLSAGATAIWAIAVLAWGLEQRVIGNWESALTMVFGSFLAGSSPEGGGAVAFPVFTKLLEVPGPVARTFGLCIQAVGMTMAAISILVAGRPFHRRGVVIGSVAAVAGFGVAVAVLGQPDQVFWPPTIGSGWVKATFSIVLATTSIMMVTHLRHGPHDGPPLPWNHRLDVGLVVVAVLGGGLASLTGTGANILVFLFLVVLADVLPKTALPSAVMIMAVVSVVGFVVFGLFDGQLDVQTVGDRVVSVGGTVTDLDAGNADLLGLWLAAVPVVVWGAPLGSLAASLVKEAHLVKFVAVLAAIEVVTTCLLVPELRTSPSLLIYLIGGLILAPAALLLARRHRRELFAGPVAIDS